MDTATRNYLSTKGLWVPSGLRSAILSMRPWSFSVSFVPVALTAALLICEGRDVEWFDVITLVQGANFAHAAANLINTLFDFYSGLDKSETADDRTLVDGMVSQNTLWALTIAFLVQAGGVCGYYVSTRGVESFLPIAAAGIGLGVAYTAKPLSLKYLGLGDLAIFAAFGPVVMAGASVGMIGWVPHSVLWLSIPTGMATTAILHANNARDIQADTAAGARTCATMLYSCTSRKHRSEHSALNLNSLYFTFLLLGSWCLGLLVVLTQVVQNTLKAIPASAFRVTPLHTRIVVAVSSLLGCMGPQGTQDAIGEYLPNASASDKQSWVQTGVWGGVDVQRDACVPAIIALVAFGTALPWALALVARFRQGGSALETLPQQTAQWVMWSGVVTCFGLVPLAVTARFCLGILFSLGGVNNLIMWHHASRLVQCKLSYVAGVIRDALCCGAGRGGVRDHSKLLPLPVAGAALAVAVLSQIAASIAFMFNVYTREAALVLVAFLVPVTFIVHDFWNMDLDGNKWDTQSEQAALEAWNKKQATVASPANDDAQSDEQGGAEGRVSAMPARGARSRSAARRRGAGAEKDEVDVAGSKSVKGVEGGVDAAAWPPLDSRAVPNFMDTFSSEFVHFFQNIGMLGGLLVYIVLSEGQA